MCNLNLVFVPRASALQIARSANTYINDTVDEYCIHVKHSILFFSSFFVCFVLFLRISNTKSVIK